MIWKALAPYAVQIISGLLAAALIAGIATWFISGQREVGRQEIRAENIEADNTQDHERNQTNETVNGLDRRDLCIELGGVQCPQGPDQ